MVAGRICALCEVRVEGDSQLAAAHAKAPSMMTLCRVFIGRRKAAQYRLMPERARDNFPSYLRSMISLRANQALVADDIVLDGRLALYHQSESWLAVADLHFGYEIS